MPMPAYALASRAPSNCSMCSNSSSSGLIDLPRDVIPTLTDVAVVAIYTGARLGAVRSRYDDARAAILAR